jgi:hypothetical protein
MSIKYYIKSARTKYKDKEGNDKTKYENIGIVMETKHGLMLKIETIPLLQLQGGSIMAYLNTPEEEHRNKTEPAPAVEPSQPPVDDDIPF